MMAYPGGWIMARPSRGLDHVERVEASEETRRRLRILLETISGQTSVEEAARRLKLSPSRVHALREQMLQGAAHALEPAPRAVEQQPARAVVDDRPATEAAPRKFSFLQRMTGAHRRESEATARPAAEEPRRAPRLDHVDGGATSRQQPADEENDLLEIPAFLRRQAN